MMLRTVFYSICLALLFAGFSEVYSHYRYPYRPWGRVSVPNDELVEELTLAPNETYLGLYQQAINDGYHLWTLEGNVHIVIQTKSREIYHCELTQNICGPWLQMSAEDDFPLDFDFTGSDTTNTTRNNIRLEVFDQKILAKETYYSLNPGYSSSNLVLLNDGTLWLYSGSALEPGIRLRLLIDFAFRLICAIPLGLIAGVIFHFVRKTMHKGESHKNA